jgi:hypothetical protein
MSFQSVAAVRGAHLASFCAMCVIPCLNERPADTSDSEPRMREYADGRGWTITVQVREVDGRITTSGPERIPGGHGEGPHLRRALFLVQNWGPLHPEVARA